MGAVARIFGRHFAARPGRQAPNNRNILPGGNVRLIHRPGLWAIAGSSPVSGPGYHLQQR
jgi:hypothetical protein